MRALAIVMVMSGAGVVEAEPLAGDVQVWQDAKLYLAPSDQAESFTLATLDKPRDERTGATLQMHVVRESGDFVEVANSDYTERCHFWGDLEIDNRIEGLHLFVRRADLAQVLVKRWSRAFPNDTSIALAPGVPVGPAITGGRLIALSAGRGEAPARFVADLQADAIGLSFTPSKRRDSSEVPSWELTTRTVVVGSQTLTFDHGLPYVTKLTPRGDHALVPFETDCAELVASVPRKQVVKPHDGALGMGSLHGPEGGGDELAMLVPRGTPLATQTGRQVAVAARDLPVAATTAAQVCVELQLAIAGSSAARPSAGKLVLCAPTRALVARPPPRTPPPTGRMRRPIIEHGSVTTSGGLDAAVIRRIVRRSDQDFIACYAAALEKAPDLKGTLTLSFTIGATGTVNQASATGVDAVSACAIAVIRKAQFPKPTGIVQVDYPLILK